MNELALFAGAGGGILGGELLGWRTVCAVENNTYAASVLLARQNDGILPPFPIWDEVRTFDGRPWRGIVDVVSGGFPCQDISSAGKGAGLDGERSGLWSEMARVVGEVRPRFVFIENSPRLITRGLDRVLCDIAEMGFDARWGVLGAHHAGAPHKRDRVWILATNAECVGSHSTENVEKLGGQGTSELCVEQPGNNRGAWWSSEPGVDRMVDGLAARVDRLKATGNGQVPRVAATAFAILAEQLMTANAPHHRQAERSPVESRITPAAVRDCITTYVGHIDDEQGDSFTTMRRQRAAR